MGRNWIRAVFVFLMCCAAFSQDPQQSQSQSGSGATPQQNPPADQSQQQQQPADQPKKHGFGDILSGKKPVSASNSAQSKDSASLGTNGLGADGMPTPAQMNESASAADEAKAQKLSTQVTNKDEVDKFIQQGNLKNGKS